ncbi:MAG: hypothetical protein J1E06_05760 [Acutalibacter sp.]|nr:hypothetical protein [Acutalibacter sp.]
MASYGAKYPKFAPITKEPMDALPEYEESVVIGRLVKADLTVEMASGKLYADDELAESVDEFVSAAIAMETDDMEDKVASVVYGAEVKEKKVHYKVGDTPPLGGLAYYKVLMRGGKKIYRGYFYPKAKAALGNDNAASKTNSITFGTNSTSFTVFAANTGDWRITEELESEAAARAWVDAQLSGVAAETISTTDAENQAADAPVAGANKETAKAVTPINSK